MVMNRRDFLKCVTAAVAVHATPSLIPLDAKFVVNAKKHEKVIGDITRTIDWHIRHNAYFVSYSASINGTEYYYGDFVDEVDAKTLRICNMNSMNAFRRRSELLLRAA